MAGSLGPTRLRPPAGRARPLRGLHRRRRARGARATGSGSGSSRASACSSSTRPASRRSCCSIYAALQRRRAARPLAVGRAVRVPAGARPRRLRLARLRRALAALVPLHVERLHRRSSSRTSSASACRPGTGSGRSLIDGHGLLLVSPVLLAAIAGLVPLLAPPPARGGGRDRDRARSSLSTPPATSCPTAALSPGPALRRRRAAVPAARPAVRARTLARSSTLVLVAVLGRGRASSTSSPGRSRTGSSSWRGRETIWSLAGLSREARVASCLLACGAARRSWSPWRRSLARPEAAGYAPRRL